MALKKLFATANDLGGMQAMLPVLKALRAQGCEVVFFVAPDAPGFPLCTGFATKFFGDYGCEQPDIQSMRHILRKEDPDVVLTNVTTHDGSIDCLTLRAAQREGVPTAALIETYPDIWLSRYGERLVNAYYRAADAIFVPDALSVGIMREHGFDEGRVRATGNPVDDGLVEERDYLPWKRKYMRRDCDIPSDAMVIAWFGTYDLDDPDGRGPTQEGRFGFGEAEAYREYLCAIRDGAAIAHANGRDLRGLFRQKPSYGRHGIAAIERELGVTVFHDERMDGPMSAIAASDVVCSLIGGTTLHQVAKLGGRLAVFYQPGATSETDDQATNRLGVTKPLYERGALRELILGIARDSSEFNRLRAGLRSAKLERGATARVILELERLASI